jgi:hypothetical protein
MKDNTYNLKKLNPVEKVYVKTVVKIIIFQ